MALLDNRLANIFPDLPAAGIRDAAVIKGLTGGDTMVAENKFERPFNLQNTAKLIFSANKAPRLSEDSDAIWRRLVIVDFPNQFLGVKADSNLVDKLLPQKSCRDYLMLHWRRYNDYVNRKPLLLGHQWNRSGVSIY